MFFMIKVKSFDMHAIAKRPDQFCYDRPQIVFAGRSNVGKSSLLRTLVNRKKLVRVGCKPGVTQSINFYVVNDEFYFVDLPGYGYAKTPKSEKKKWKLLIERYFKEAINVKKVVLILDVRRDVSKNDEEFFHWAKSYHLPILIVITKTDKVSKNNAMSKRMEIMKKFDLQSEDCLLFSALKRTGKDDIWSSFAVALS